MVCRPLTGSQAAFFTVSGLSLVTIGTVCAALTVTSTPALVACVALATLSAAATGASVTAYLGNRADGSNFTYQAYYESVKDHMCVILPAMLAWIAKRAFEMLINMVLLKLTGRSFDRTTAVLVV